MDDEKRLIVEVRKDDMGARLVYADLLESRDANLLHATILRSNGGLLDQLLELIAWLHSIGVFQQYIKLSRGLSMLNMLSGPIEPGMVVDVIARPQEIAFRPSSMMIPPSISKQFLIIDIRVGAASQFRGREPIPAVEFTSKFSTACPSCDRTLPPPIPRFDTVHMSMDFVIAVQNISQVPETFIATIFGQSVDY